MQRKHIILLLTTTSILAIATAICVLRWDAWFSMPPEPTWQSDTLSTNYLTFADDTTFTCQFSDTLSMIILGDVHNTLSHADYITLSQCTPTPQCYAQVGDFVEREQFYYKQQLKHDIQCTLFDSIPAITCPGNHEYTKGLYPQLPNSWLQSYHHPLNGPTQSKGSSYFVDFHYVRYIVIDTESLTHLADYTRLNTWVKQSIRLATQPWVVVMMHKPVYSSREGRSNPLIWLTFAQALKDADVVFSGHDHTYARLGEAIQDASSDSHTVWIGTTSTTHSRTLKQRHHFDKALQGGPFYEHMIVTEHTLQIYSNTLTHQCVDSIMLSK